MALRSDRRRLEDNLSEPPGGSLTATQDAPLAQGQVCVQTNSPLSYWRLPFAKW